MATYSGALVTVEPVAKAYPVGTAVKLHIVGDVTAVEPHAPAWHSTYEVYDEAGKLLGSSVRYHSVAPWTPVDYAHDDFEISIGAQVAEGLRGKVKMSAAG